MSPLGGGSRVDDRLQHEVDAEARLGRDRHGLRGVDADHVLDLLLDPVGLGGGQVDLVEDGDDLVIGVDRLVDVGERLGFHALRGVDHQQRALAGRRASATPRSRSRRGRACPIRFKM